MHCVPARSGHGFYSIINHKLPMTIQEIVSYTFADEPYGHIDLCNWLKWICLCFQFDAGRLQYFIGAWITSCSRQNKHFSQFLPSSCRSLLLCHVLAIFCAPILCCFHSVPSDVNFVPSWVHGLFWLNGFLAKNTANPPSRRENRKISQKKLFVSIKAPSNVILLSSKTKENAIGTTISKVFFGKKRKMRMQFCANKLCFWQEFCRFFSVQHC